MVLKKGEGGKQPIDHKGITNPHGPKRLGEPDRKRLVYSSYFRNHRVDPLPDVSSK